MAHFELVKKMDLTRVVHLLPSELLISLRYFFCSLPQLELTIHCKKSFAVKASVNVTAGLSLAL